MATDDLARQWAKASTAIALIYIAQNILIWVPKESNRKYTSFVVFNIHMLQGFHYCILVQHILFILWSKNDKENTFCNISECIQLLRITSIFLSWSTSDTLNKHCLMFIDNETTSNTYRARLVCPIQQELLLIYHSMIFVPIWRRRIITSFITIYLQCTAYIMHWGTIYIKCQSGRKPHASSKSALGGLRILLRVTYRIYEYQNWHSYWN